VYDAYLERIAELVRLLASHGQHVLIDFHQDMYKARFSGEGFPDWAVLLPEDGRPQRASQTIAAGVRSDDRARCAQRAAVHPLDNGGARRAVSAPLSGAEDGP
jgi:hypothetical protein